MAYWEPSPTEKIPHFSRVTDIPINQTNLMKLMRVDRARWKIENETSNTLKTVILCGITPADEKRARVG
uniref:Uncharacterized protein n=1 Tax=Candidatus Kentrum sp. DK TaxID=2126562 RepID=A0A450SDL2_9GAMM|nr:MAG: hypothetical protein BECKDK2373B_GA0170837_10292 [Candidatus Kentron sp. DK]VFJ66736.1 MAG: hypothetical protein BECKDK2373C_GA0170839_11542 [Candidatus Kentron sp. DK]